MRSVIFLFYRRLRAPILVLIAAYSISVAGFVLIPGRDDAGAAYQMDFFHAFYFVSFMGSTIGFGEIPYPFTPMQRMWATVAIYLTVIGWLFAIGKILTLVQDTNFLRAVTEQRFCRQVRALREPFWLICGCGDTGGLLVRALARRQTRAVVVERKLSRINELNLADLPYDVPSLVADARDVAVLKQAGLLHPQCLGVVALTDDDQVNVKIAITSKLLAPKLPVISRASDRDTEGNLASFDTDHIVNAFRVFADHLAIAIRAPSVHLLYESLISLPGQTPSDRQQPPRGPWVVCGHGRFGSAVNRYLQYEGIPTTVIDPRVDLAPVGAVIGLGTEAVTLREAHVDKAVAIVAGTDSDTNNLSIVVTALALNPDLYTIARQNRHANDEVFDAARLDLVMQSSRIIVWRILPLLTYPLLARFLQVVRHHNEEWARTLLQRLRAMCEGVTPETWSVEINAEQAPAVYGALRRGQRITLDHLQRDPIDRDQRLAWLPLLLEHRGKEIVLPEPDQALASGDRLLLSARPGEGDRLRWTLSNPNALRYTSTGDELPEGSLWRWWTERRNRRSRVQADRA